MTTTLTRQELVEALHSLETVERHPAVVTLLEATASEYDKLLEIVTEIPEDYAGIIRREQAIGELRAARCVAEFISDWKRVAADAVRDLDNNPQPTIHDGLE